MYRKATKQEQRRYGVQMRVQSAWREPQQTVAVQAYQAQNRHPYKRAYIQKYADLLGITYDEACRRIVGQRLAEPEEVGQPLDRDGDDFA